MKRSDSGFSARLVLILLLVGVFSFSAFMTLSAFEPDLRRDRSGGAHALSRSAIGFAGLTQLARGMGSPVSISRTPIGSSYQEGLIVLTPQSAHLLRDDNGQTLPFLADPYGRVLVVLPKWNAIPRFDKPGWIGPAETIEEEHVAEILAIVAPDAALTRAQGAGSPELFFSYSSGMSQRAAEIGALQTISGASLDPVIVDSQKRTILGRVGDTTLYVLSDPDFLNNQALDDSNAARAALAILHAATGEQDGLPLVFDVTLNGFQRNESLLRLALQPPFLAATLSLLAVAFLLAWRSFSRAGPEVHAARAIALGKGALADNSAALIRLARRETRMGWGYAALIGAGAAEMVGAGKVEGDQVALLDRVGEAQGVSHKFSELAAEAAAADTRAKLVAAARKLHAWKEEMLRATR